MDSAPTRGARVGVGSVTGAGNELLLGGVSVVEVSVAGGSGVRLFADFSDGWVLAFLGLAGFSGDGVGWGVGFAGGSGSTAGGVFRVAGSGFSVLGATGSKELLKRPSSMIKGAAVGALKGSVSDQ